MSTVLRGEIAAPDHDLFDWVRLATAGYLAGYGNQGTRRNYSESLAAWGIWCDVHGIRPFDAKRPHLEMWAREMEQAGRKPATVSNRLIAVCGWYRYCHEEGYLDRNPAALVRRPKVPAESSTAGLDRAELGTLIRTAERHHPRSYALVSLLAYNGLRISEALGIDLEDFSEERGHRIVHIMGKGSKPDRVPIPPQLGRALDAYIDVRTVGPLFLTVKGPDRRLSRYAAAELVKRLATTAGITKNVHPHTLRHASITAALDAGVDLRDVAIFARHADPRTTTRYDRARQNLDRNAAYTVARWVAGAA